MQTNPSKIVILSGIAEFGGMEAKNLPNHLKVQREALERSFTRVNPQLHPCIQDDRRNRREGK